MKKLLVGLMVMGLVGVATADIILDWSFSGTTPIVNQVANDVIAANLDTGGIYNDLTRGAGAGTSAGGSSFRTTGFQNNGIAVGNTDYFQFIVSAASGYTLSLTGITGAFAGTTTFSADPGVSHQWGYSFDGSSFTLIDSPVARIGNGTSSFDLSGVGALQNVGASSDVYLRYYATGQTTTGGWGFFSTGGTASALAVDGTISVIPEPSVFALISIGALGIVRFMRRRQA
jgi:hypothetical protein